MLPDDYMRLYDLVEGEPVGHETIEQLSAAMIQQQLSGACISGAEPEGEGEEDEDKPSDAESE